MDASDEALRKDIQGDRNLTTGQTQLLMKTLEAQTNNPLARAIARDMARNLAILGTTPSADGLLRVCQHWRDLAGTVESCLRDLLG